MSKNHYTFDCDNPDCKEIHKMSTYAIAQLAMGHTVTFSGCKCGQPTQLHPDIFTS